jgi:hypothetical protein
VTVAVCLADDAKSGLRDKQIDCPGDSVLLTFQPLTRKALLCAVAFALAGCSGTSKLFDDKNEGGFFSKPIDLFSSPDWAKPATTNVQLGPTGPVSPEDLVSADGQCPPAPPEPAQAAAPAPAPAAGAPKAGIGFEGGLESPAGGAAAPAPIAVGGIALGMTECQAVRRAGTPSNVAISAGAGGERRVVLTYLGGAWPGIYTFTGGRLKEVDAAPEQEKPKAPAKKRKVKRAKSASSSSTEREYVR